MALTGLRDNLVHKCVKISLRRQGFENKIAIRYETNMVTVHLEIQLTVKSNDKTKVLLGVHSVQLFIK